MIDYWTPLSLRLWRALWRDPAALPKAERWMGVIEPAFRSERFQSLGAGDLFQLGGGLLILLVLGPILLIVLGGVGLLGGTVRGGLTAMVIARRLAHQYTARRFEVLATTPGGALAVCWAVLVYHHHRTEPQHALAGTVHVAQNILSTLIGIGMVLLGGLTILGFAEGGGNLSSTTGQVAIHGVSVLLCAYALMHHDSATGPLVGAAIGIWVGAGAARQTNGRVAALAAYVALVGGAWLAVITVWLVLMGIFVGTPWLAHFITLALHIVLREMVLMWAWRRAIQALELPSAAPVDKPFGSSGR